MGMHNGKDTVAEKTQVKVPCGFEAAKRLLSWHTGGCEVSEGGLVWGSLYQGCSCHPQLRVNDFPSLVFLL